MDGWMDRYDISTICLYVTKATFFNASTISFHANLNIIWWTANTEIVPIFTKVVFITIAYFISSI